jgi:hypothetical protein
LYFTFASSDKFHFFFKVWALTFLHLFCPDSLWNADFFKNPFYVEMKLICLIFCFVFFQKTAVK